MPFGGRFAAPKWCLGYFGVIEIVSDGVNLIPFETTGNISKCFKIVSHLFHALLYAVAAASNVFDAFIVFEGHHVSNEFNVFTHKHMQETYLYRKHTGYMYSINSIVHTGNTPPVK